MGKRLGEDSIHAESFKENKDVLLPQLHALLLQCWRQREMPHKMRDTKIVTLYQKKKKKKKRDKGDFNNYGLISLLCVAGKIFARVLLKRPQRLGDCILSETQPGFRADRSMTDTVFTLRHLQEKCREQRKPLFITFVDLTKAFDTTSLKSLYKILEKSVIHLFCCS